LRDGGFSHPVEQSFHLNACPIFRSRLCFNLGTNLGKVSGAGIDDHVHTHIVPRWQGDTNFMPVIAQTKVISESMDAVYKRLKGRF
jgi:diadenosine tetraphosphate (Ap4A) HIT family hydrolase